MRLKWGVDYDPRAQGRLKGVKPVAVLDIGSNSVRLVVYERHARALTPLYNEKASCSLGRGVAATGRIAEENVARALKAMKRFALVTKLMNVGKVHVLATSAVREAQNGELFSRQVAEVMGAPVRVLSGAEEAHFAALGVVAGIPGFTGVMGDLGGGSLELAYIENGKDESAGETHPLGVIRLQDDSDGSSAKAVEIAKKIVSTSDLIAGAPKGGTFCAIGGTWRSIAKLHQHVRGYPLHMIQHYAVPASDLIELCDQIVAQNAEKDTYDGADLMSSSRRSLVPFGAAVMSETLKAGGFETVVFSALGVREGFLFGELSAADQQTDPLLQACAEMAVLRSRAPDSSRELDAFADNFFAAAGIEETAEQRRLRQAACYLSDIGWRGHPDYRGEQCVDLVAYGALIGIDHPGRAFVAEVLAVRYMGLKQQSVSQALMDLAGAEGNARAKLLGAFMRVAFHLSPGMTGILPKVSFAVVKGTLLLELPSDLAFLNSERLQSRLNTLATQAGFDNARVDAD